MFIGGFSRTNSRATWLVILGRGIWLGADAPKRRWVESILLIGILLTLTLTGAGALAIDLPY